MTANEEPTTEAGRAHHLAIHRGDLGACITRWGNGECSQLNAILAIEAEARATATLRLREATGRFVRRVGGLTVRFEGGRQYVRVPSEWIDDLAAVLHSLSVLPAESKEPLPAALAADSEPDR